MTHRREMLAEPLGRSRRGGAALLHWASRALVALMLAPLTLYRLTLSRFMPPVCRFEPSCSAYMREALIKHGPFRGLALGIWRVLRCQPFARHGCDPVPPRTDRN